MKTSFAVRVLLAPISFYQRFISPSLPPTCRFEPTCSSYAVGALQQHGALRGSWLAVRRISRCHPWHAGGYDPVPTAGERPAPVESSVTVDVVTVPVNAEQVADEYNRTRAETRSVVLTTEARSAAAAPLTPRSYAA